MLTAAQTRQSNDPRDQQVDRRENVNLPDPHQSEADLLTVVIVHIRANGKVEAPFLNALARVKNITGLPGPKAPI